ncbi:MAG: cysteine--tRNA ligase [Rudaea sp.]
MKIRLHNSLTRRVDEFVPLNPSRVTVYLCGPTVYNFVHIGNARGPVVFGLLVRLLKRKFGGDHVVYARNITDVDDKINAAASEAAVPIDVVTARYAAAYREDLARLGVDDPDIVPYATAHIPQIIAMCERLISRGNAYVASGHVLFDVSSYADYGHLSGRSTEEMIAGARVEVAPYKKNAADFVLWKPSTPDLPGWDSPWGRGRPGWHIECSAMAETHLGETIDIHAGGNDLMFPHHENEVAQSTCAHGGRIFARFWLHNGMLAIEGRKMSKSLGNTMVLHDLLDRYPPELLRYMLMKAHYRQPLDWSESALDQARRTLDGLYTTLRDLADVPAERCPELPSEFADALADDLNTPEALAQLARIADDARRATGRAARMSAKSALLGAGAFLGLLQVDPEQWFQGSAATATILPSAEALSRVAGLAEMAAAADGHITVANLVAARTAAKQDRDFARADGIRTLLEEHGVAIEDTPQGPRWKRIVSGVESA